jgi:fused signal recognition particle receptor
MSWFNKLKNSLKKSSEKISFGISSIITKKTLDQQTLVELEEILISSDIGVDTSQKIIKELSKSKFEQEVTDTEIKAELSKIISTILRNASGKIKIDKTPHVILMCGANGNGKTTTIGKMAMRFHSQDKKITIAACDTFRAAAVEQLEIWASKSKAKFISGPQNSDPASVAYKAYTAAKENNSDILFIDTAGRLANKSNLMQELSKIVKTLQKIDPHAPHDVILVLDATTGQNAINQIENFKEFVKLTGLVITKLDGSAKAGIVVALTNKFAIPIVAIGVGESLDDLDDFEPEDFANNLIGIR